MRSGLHRLAKGVLIGALVWSTPGLAHNHAADHQHESERAYSSDHEQARRAQAAGEALPLQDVLQRVAQDYPGQVLKVEFEQGENGVWLYELRILQSGGRMLKLKVDARDAVVLAVRGRPVRK